MGDRGGAKDAYAEAGHEHGTPPKEGADHPPKCRKRAHEDSSSRRRTTSPPPRMFLELRGAYSPAAKAVLSSARKKESNKFVSTSDEAVFGMPAPLTDFDVARETVTTFAQLLEDLNLRIFVLCPDFRARPGAFLQELGPVRNFNHKSEWIFCFSVRFPSEDGDGRVRWCVDEDRIELDTYNTTQEIELVRNVLTQCKNVLDDPVTILGIVHGRVSSVRLVQHRLSKQQPTSTSA